MQSPEFRPRLIFWELTTGCNLRCMHCRASATELMSPDDLNYEESCAVIDQIAEYAPFILVLSGGEPLWRKDVFDLAKRAASRNIIVALATISMTRATGEVLPRFGEDTLTHIFSSNGNPKASRPFWGLRHRRRQLMALIITGQPEAVSRRILSDLSRGVTALSGKGMYTGQERAVLICALTVTEVHNLKVAVAKEDPNAFVVVSNAQEILGRGFNPLAEA